MADHPVEYLSRDPDLSSMAGDLCQLATLCHLVGDREKRDVAVGFAADLLQDASRMAAATSTPPVPEAQDRPPREPGGVTIPNVVVERRRAHRSKIRGSVRPRLARRHRGIKS